MNLQTAKFLLNKTKEDYECIAESFNHTRKYLWADFKEFKKYIQDKNCILDLGCGNGRLFEMFNNKKINYTGVDNCKGLIKEAKNKYSSLGESFLVADALDAS
ncbi:class I SAM-dependent methyltransferase, partial [Patescibacteria group bacterium]|nr:class I SAM-dependent methyltransferase [Patescibacteria group bacterium]